MCGIAGIVHLDGGQVDAGLLDQMTDALAHRGPDGRGVFIDGNVGLGHRRLAILDLSDAGAQPMRSADGSVIVTYNGEVYNFKEKRRELKSKGYSFHSECDTEVLIALYQEYGIDCIEHLRGMFAFAIYDKGKRRLFCARDRVGQKPFKYYFDGKTFAFASELKAILKQPFCNTEIDHEAIHHFLTMMYMPAPLTGFKNIQKLEAAHYILLDLNTGSFKKDRYWRLDYRPNLKLSKGDWIDQTRSTLRESVKLRQISDVPVGAFLSGGIDSGAVVTFMAENSEMPIETFSIGSAVDSHNELPEADMLAKKVGCNHHPHVVTPDLVEILPTLVGLYEEPYADASAMPTYYVSQLTSEHVKVALTGDGGDENFAGYVRYPILRFSRKWEKCCAIHPLVTLGTSVLSRYIKTTFLYRCHRFQSTMRKPWPERYLQYLSYFTEKEKEAIYADSFENEEYVPTDEYYAALTQEARLHANTPVEKAISMDVMTYLPDDLMPKVDMASMHFGLECRAPFLDHHLLELTAQMPSHLKLHGRERKYLLKESLRGILPDQTLKKRKTGFRIPLNHWFRSELRDYVHDRLLADSPHKWDFFDRDKIAQMLHQYYESDIDYSDHIWALLWLDEWFTQYAG